MAIKPQIRKDEYFDELETMTVEKREAYFESRLTETVANAYKNAPAAKRILDDAEVSPSQIKTIKDLELLPVTRKTDIIEMQKSNPPYGGFLNIPENNVERVFISPGPIYEPMQHTGIKWFSKSLWAAGFRKGDVVINTFTYHMSPAGILCHEALSDCGATAVPVGTGHTEVTVKAMLDLRATGYVGTPSFLMAIIKQAEELGYDFKNDFYIKRAWFTGEMLASSVRQTLEKDYDIDTYQAYAVTEPGGAIAYECSCKDGLHLMDEYIVEIVNPSNGKQLTDGEVGEVVVTPVHNNTWGLLRFGTGDLSSIVDDVCPCGRTTKKLTGIQGRIGEAVKVRGMFVVSNQVESLFAQYREVAKWQITVARIGQRDEMTITAELCDDNCDKIKLADEIGNRFKSICLINPDKIELVPAGTLPQDSKTIVDNRKWD